MIKRVTAVVIMIFIFMTSIGIDGIKLFSVHATEPSNKQIFFLTVNNFAMNNRGGWQADAWTPPSPQLPSQLLTYKANNGQATTEIYISEPGRYQIAGYYKSHATNVSSRWFKVGVGDTIDSVNYGTYKFANFTSAPAGVTGYFEGWDSGYTIDLTEGKKTIGLYATSIGSVRCAAIAVYKLNDGETLDPVQQFSELINYQDYTAPENFFESPKATLETNTSIRLDWKPVTDANSGVKYYEIYKDAALYDKVPSSTTTYLFHDISKWDKYTFKVKAWDAFGHSNSDNNATTTLSLSVSAEYTLSMPEGYTEPVMESENFFMDNIDIKKNSEGRKSVMFAVALFNSVGTLQKLSIDQQDVDLNEITHFGTGFILPKDISNYYIKTFIWNVEFAPIANAIRYEHYDYKSVKVNMNSEAIQYTTSPVLLGDTIMVPAKETLEMLGAQPEWSEDINGVIAAVANKQILLRVGKREASVDNVIKTLDEAPFMKDGVEMAPLRFICETMGASLTWNGDLLSADITNIQGQPVFISPYDFESHGTWLLDLENDTAFNQMCLMGVNTNVSVQTAIVNEKLAASGQYRVWLRSFDSADYLQGKRSFKLRVNDVTMLKTFGKHGRDGFFWEDGGIVTLPKGNLKVELVDSSKYYARCDAIYITPELDKIPSNEAAQMTLLSNANKPDMKIRFPEWAKTNESTLNQNSIENENVKLMFYSVKTPYGKNIIQRQTYLKENGQWLAVDNRTDNFGYLLMTSDQSSIYTYEDSLYPKWQSNINVNGSIRKYFSNNIFKAAYHEWLIPTTIEKIGNVIRLTAVNDYADLTTDWVLEQNAQEPKVICKLNIKKNGTYSLGAFNSPEISKENTEFALIPYRVNGMGIPSEGKLTMEMHTTTPMSSITLPETNQILSGKKITYGMVIDPKQIPDRFLYRSDNSSKFGLTIDSESGNLRPGIFAPMLGSEESKMIAGQNYEFVYRPTAKIGGWYDSYNHVVKDIFSLNDYRKNYKASLSDTIFNVRKLMLDDVYSGWDTAAKGHYYMETKNKVAQGNPLIAMQDYLLSEDDDLLTRRTIPTMAGLLTQSSRGFNYGLTQTNDTITPMGEPMKQYSTTVFGGAYWMTRGLVPSLRQVGIDNGVRNNQTDIPAFSEYIWYYKYTGDITYLNKAKQEADLYLQNVVYKPHTNLLGTGEFINIAYAPQMSPLLDMYEITGDKKYLDGAEAAARIFITTLWVVGLDNGKTDGNVSITSDMVKSRQYFSPSQYSFWWYGDKRWRLGFPMYQIGESKDSQVPISDETVPAWVPSRVGLGLEQTMSFRSESLNIMMSNWAPDLLRIATYTGDKTLEAQARNAVLGRGANYPGYYYNRKSVLQMNEDYPYKGPDFTSIYYHHIPVYLAVLEDYIMTQMWSWSNGKINFPFVREQGYAYFWNRQYGFESGSFFDESNMWLWLKKGIIKPDNIQIDWVAAKKDGKVAFALMNEDYSDITSTIELGSEIPNGSSYTGKGIMYTNDGDKSEINIVNGKFTVTIPAHKLVGIVVSIPEIKAPDFTKTAFNMQQSSSNPTSVGTTSVTNQLGGAYVLQMSPDKYFAYVYTKNTPDQIAKAVFYFKMENGTWQQIVSTRYPFDAIYKVDDVNKSVNFYVETYDKNGVLLQKTDEQTMGSMMKQ